MDHKMLAKESNRNGVQKPQMKRFSIAAHNEFICELNINSFHLCFASFSVCVCAAADVAKTECQITIIIIEYEWTTERKRERAGVSNEWAHYAVLLLLLQHHDQQQHKYKCALAVREYQLLNQFSSFVSMNDAFNITIVIIIVVVAGEHCFLHNMLCTARLLHLHKQLCKHTHLNYACNSFFTKELWKRRRRRRWLWWGQRQQQRQHQSNQRPYEN